MGASEQSPIVRFGIGLGAFIAVLSGPVSGFFLTQIFLEARASADWPHVPGTIIRAEVNEAFSGRFVADVSYTYRVNDSDLTGSRIRASDGEYNVRDGAVQAIQGLTSGQAVQVYYNPVNPRESVLKPGAAFQDYVLLCVPVLLFGCGILLIRRLWLTRKITADVEESSNLQ